MPATKESAFTTDAKPEEKLPATPPAAAVPAVMDTVPDFLAGDIADVAGAGTSDRAEDQVMPFLYIVQKGSPQVNRRDPEYIEGVEVGDILNTATRRVFKGDGPEAGVRVLPVLLEKREVEWTPRSSGGGYVSTHPADTPLLRSVREVKKPQGKGVLRMLPNGNQLVETNYHLCIVVDTLELVVVPFTSSGLSMSKLWNSMMRTHKVRKDDKLFIAPSFSRVYRLRTAYRQNELGDWYTWAFDDQGFVGKPEMDAYQLAKEFFLRSKETPIVLGRPPAAAAPETGEGEVLEGSLADDVPI